MRIILILLLAFSTVAQADCEDFVAAQKDFSKISELFKFYPGTLLTSSQVATATALLKNAAKHEVLGPAATRKLMTILKSGNLNLLSKNSRELLHVTPALYTSRRAAYMTLLADVALVGTRSSLLFLAISDLAFHIISPPKAGADLEKREAAVDGLVMNPTLLFHLSKRSACQFLHDSPDIALAFERLKAEMDELKKMIAYRDDENLYGDVEERKMWKEAIKKTGVVMIPFDFNLE